MSIQSYHRERSIRSSSDEQGKGTTIISDRESRVTFWEKLCKGRKIFEDLASLSNKSKTCEVEKLNQ